MSPHAINPPRAALPSNIFVRGLLPKHVNDPRLMECLLQLPNEYKYTVKSQDYCSTLSIYVNVYDSEENERLVQEMTDSFHIRLGMDPRTGKSVKFETADEFHRMFRYSPEIDDHYALLGLTTPPDRQYYIDRPDEDSSSSFESIHYGYNSPHSSDCESSDC